MRLPFNDPRSFQPREIMDYLTAERMPGQLKSVPEHFIVRESHPARPGESLTIGEESDFTPEELLYGERNSSPNVALFTCVKRGLTTWGAQDWISSEVSRQLGRRVTVKDSGLKDRWAVTAQTMSITGVTPEELRQCNFGFRRPHNADFFIKDIRPGNPVRRGQHDFNRFEIRALVDEPEQKLQAYVEPLLEKLAGYNMQVPNAFGRQRLGRRQNLHVVGKTLVGGGFTDPEAPPFSSNIEAAMYLFLFDCSGSEQPRARQLREEMKRHWLYDLNAMRQVLDGRYRLANMNVEYDIANRLANTERYGGNFAKVLRDMSNRCSLWVGAWQAYWFNQCLADEMRHRDWDMTIPLPMDTPVAREYYGQQEGCQQAIVDLDNAEPLVKELFLLPWQNKHHNKPKNRGPHRKAFTEVKNFTSQCYDGAWQVGFDLRSGAYATNVLGLFIDIAEPDEAIEDGSTPN